MATTKRVKGSRAEWNETLTLYATPGEAVTVCVLHGKKNHLMGSAVTTVPGDFVNLTNKSISKTLELSLSVSSWTPGRRPTISVLFALTEGVVSSPVTTMKQELANLSITAAAVHSAIPERKTFPVVMSYLQKFVEIGSVAAEVLQTQYDQDDKVKDLWNCVCTTLDFLNEAEPLQSVKHLSGTIQAIMEQLHTCIVYLTQVRARTKADEDAELKCLPGFNLGGIHGNSFCLAGTRTKVLDDMLNWVVSDSGSSMLWLSGPAGTGKSSIAASFALQLESMNWLGAFFRFHRDSAEEITPCHLFGSIAYQLATINDDLHAHILAAIKKKSAHITLLQKQAQDLVVIPLQNSIIEQPLVIVIDALDESAQEADRNGLPGRRSLIQTIVAEFATLPNQVKILVTSRKEGSISQILPKFASLQQMDLTNVDDTELDITNFIQHRCRTIQQEYDLPGWWPSHADVSTLASHAGNLFVWAGVACSYIQEGPDPISKLHWLLSETNLIASGDLDQLYTQIIENSLPKTAHIHDKVSWHCIVGILLCIKIPISIEALDTLLDLSMTIKSKRFFDGQEIFLTSSRFILLQIMPLLKEYNGTVQLLHKFMTLKSIPLKL
ncbi:hypothetical protein C0995_001665 [Termitomyces sp. Mi166|nr:hypothetical protein C0995_001665 [Termitomyces sp. Mi166\